MDYVPLGQSGLKISRYVLGTLTFAGTNGFEPMGSLDAIGASRLIDMALDAGVNSIDTANLYSKGDSEEVLGEALAGRRDRVLLFSKARMPMGEGPNDGGASRHHILSQIDGSLSRLRTDHLDMYWVHAWDGVTPVEETVEVMTGLVKAGKIRYWGVSNYSGWQLTKIAMTARTPGFIAPVAHQLHYAPHAREAEYEMLPAAQDFGLASMVWSPLGEGLLTGKIDRDTPAPAGTRQGQDWPEPYLPDTEQLYRVIDVLKEVADESAATVPQVALAWLRERPGIDAIVLGARNEEQLRDNLDSWRLELSAEQSARIERAGRPAALYPFWHRAQTAMDRPSPFEKESLNNWRDSQGLERV